MQKKLLLEILPSWLKKLFLLVSVKIFSVSIMAKAQNPSPQVARTPSPEITQFMDQSLAHNGGGITIVSDATAAVVNPAGLTNRRIFSLGGSLLWKDENIRATQISSHDSYLSQVAAGFIYQSTAKVTGGEDQRVVLGLGQRIDGGPISVGLSGDYRIIDKASANKKDKNYFGLKLGANYTFGENFQIGAFTGGYFNKSEKVSHGIGAGFGLLGFFLFHGDVILTQSSIKNSIAGIVIQMKQFVDLRTSYKYDHISKQHTGSVGIALKTDSIALTYVLHKPVLAKKDILHNVGLALNVAM